MTENYQLIKESLQHWFRMRKFYRKSMLLLSGIPTIEFRSIMCSDIGESWYAKFCPLCQKYLWGDNCGQCPISVKNISCLMDKSVWYTVADSGYAYKWYENSKKMIQLLWKLLLEERNSDEQK